MAIPAVVSTVLLFHLISLLLTVFRLVHRTLYYHLWFDDVLIALSASAQVFLLGILLLIVPNLDPTQYRTVLGIVFIVLWVSRASLVMTAARMLRTSRIKVMKSLALAIALLSIGIAFSVLAPILCSKESNCKEPDLCLCYLPVGLVISIFIMDVIVNMGVLYMSNRILYPNNKTPTASGRSDASEPPPTRRPLPERPEMLARKRLVAVGFSTCIFISISSAVCWIWYMTRVSDNHLLFLMLANFVPIVAVLVANIPVVVGIMNRRLYPQGAETRAQEISLDVVQLSTEILETPTEQHA